MSPSIDPAERLLDLVIALVNTSGRMTKQQVRSSVAGYMDGAGAVSDEAFERMFERDKDTLRALGVPVLTVTDARHGDDVGYRIDVDAYALPAVQLTAAELGVLSLAVQVWQDASLRADSTRALTKLRAVGQGPSATDLLAGLAPRVRADGSAFGPLVEAVQQRQVVRFTYRAATTGEVRERTVEPWRLLARRGGWGLVGRDRDRGAARSFRLGRIQGRVRPLGPPHAFAAPTEAELTQALGGWAPGPERTAALAVVPDRAAALRARAAPDETFDIDAVPGARTVLTHRDLIHVRYRSAWELAEEVVGYGAAVVVLAPDPVREAVLGLLRAASRLDIPARVGADAGIAAVLGSADG
ncbi:MAG: WYL domain-containing protein [Micrococcales bacterium]|nr:WYL domain-containing protein [Micrococcales bacterium]